MLAKLACRHLAAGGPTCSQTGLLWPTVANLQLATSVAIYKVLTCTFPTPLVERVRGDLPWHHIWPRLQGPSLEAVEVDLHFSVIHGLPDVQANRHLLGVDPSPACLTCQPQAASRQSFTSSPAAPEPLQPGTCSSSRPPSPLEWPTQPRDPPLPGVATNGGQGGCGCGTDGHNLHRLGLSHQVLQARVSPAARGGPLFSIFWGRWPALRPPPLHQSCNFLSTFPFHVLLAYPHPPPPPRLDQREWRGQISLKKI